MFKKIICLHTLQSPLVLHLLEATTLVMAYLTPVQNLGGLIESTGIQTVFSSF